MTNNLALFFTHHVFLTDVDLKRAAGGEGFGVMGHCVPVWVDAKTGRTTEPAKEIFCWYQFAGLKEGPGEVEVVQGGFRLTLPSCPFWSPPEPIDFTSIASWSSEMREAFLKEREAWWFNNPKPPDAQDLLNGHLRFDLKKYNVKFERRKCSIQHVVEISSLESLSSSLVS